MAISSSAPDLEEQEPQDTSPLLGTTHHDDDPAKLKSNYIRIIIAVTCAVFLVEIGDFILRAPTIRLMEDTICRKYYDSQGNTSVNLNLPIPEERCKIAPVQTELAMLRGWDTTFSCIPGILLAIP